MFGWLVHAETSTAVDLLPGEKRGKQIYLHGTSSAGREISAILGQDEIEVPAAALTCGNCHGPDGLGRAEGGVIPSNITWGNLTKSYGHQHPGGRRHAPFSEESLKRSITMGIDPASNRLQVAMPRYRMAAEDLGDLISYLKRIGLDRDPGLTDASIRIGTFLPESGPLGEMGLAMQGVMDAYFKEVNHRGGIYNRRIEFLVAKSGDGNPGFSDEAGRWLKESQVFALNSPFIAGNEDRFAELVRAETIPVIGPFTLYPQVKFPLNRNVFYIYSGLGEQFRVLVEYATREHEEKIPPVAIAYVETVNSNRVAETIEAEFRKNGWATVQTALLGTGNGAAGDLVRRWKEEGVELLFLPGWGEAEKNLLRECERENWMPQVFLTVAMIGGDIQQLLEDYHGKIRLAVSTLPRDRDPVEVQELQQFLDRNDIPRRYAAAQISAYSASRILVEGLKRAGQDLSREKLVTALEGMYEYETGLTPLISYGPNRRIGALGAYVLAADGAKQQIVPVSGWIDLK